MQARGFIVGKTAIAPSACASIRTNALAQARAQAVEERRRRPIAVLARALGLTARLEAREAAAESSKPHEQRGITGPHGRLLIPVSPDTPFVASALRAAFQGLGGEAAARQAGLTPAAWLVELAVLVALPGAAEQPPHLDVLPRDALSMATLFLPLQDITAANGATVLYPAPPSEVAARCDWDAMQRGAGGGRTFSADGTDTADDTVGAAEARMRAEFAEDAAASAGLSMPVSPPWTRFSKPALGLGTPLSMALKAGDALWMDYRCFHHGGANRSDELRAVLYATFSEDREEGEGAETMDAEAGHGDHTSFSMAPRQQCHCLSEYLGARL